MKVLITPPQPTMTPSERKAALILAGVSQREIALKTKRSDQQVSRVIRGEATDPVIRRAIAKALGKPLDEVFPAAQLAA